MIVTHLGVAVEIEDLPLTVGSARRSVRVPRKSGFVVGDEVEVDDAERLTLVPRRTELRRAAAGGGVHVVAANLDVLFVVAAVDPPARAGLVDRAAVAARSAGVEPILVVNEANIPIPKGSSPRCRRARARCASSSRAPRAPWASTSSPQSCAKASVARSSAPRAWARARCSTGSSPKPRCRRARYPSATGAGRHTTTASTLTRLAGGGGIVDTPGIREYGLVDVTPGELAHAFPGFAVVEDGCKFRDCLHSGEPGCAVQRAVDEGRVSESRYIAYRTLLAELRGG